MKTLKAGKASSVQRIARDSDFSERYHDTNLAPAEIYWEPANTGFPLCDAYENPVAAANPCYSETSTNGQLRNYDGVPLRSTIHENDYNAPSKSLKTSTNHMPPYAPSCGVGDCTWPDECSLHSPMTLPGCKALSDSFYAAEIDTAYVEDSHCPTLSFFDVADNCIQDFSDRQAKLCLSYSTFASDTSAEDVPNCAPESFQSTFHSLWSSVLNCPSPTVEAPLSEYTPTSCSY